MNQDLFDIIYAVSDQDKIQKLEENLRFLYNHILNYGKKIRVIVWAAKYYDTISISPIEENLNLDIFKNFCFSSVLHDKGNLIPVDSSLRAYEDYLEITFHPQDYDLSYCPIVSYKIYYKPTIPSFNEEI